MRDKNVVVLIHSFVTIRVVKQYTCNSFLFSVKKEVTSYYRSCSREDLGNECIPDTNRLTCTFSCQGDYCNKNDTGHAYERYYEEKNGAFAVTYNTNISVLRLLTDFRTQCLLFLLLYIVH